MYLTVAPIAKSGSRRVPYEMPEENSKESNLPVGVPETSTPSLLPYERNASPAARAPHPSSGWR